MSKVAGKTAVGVRAEGGVGAVCLMGPCALCGRTFDVQNGRPRLVARDPEGRPLGLVCVRCASVAGLAERLLSGARRVRFEASRMERLAEGGVAVDPAARQAATAARAVPKDGL